MLWLGARDEKNIIVACHSGFLLNVFNSAIEFPGSEAASNSQTARMQSWFETGTASFMSLLFVTKFEPHSQYRN